MTSLFRPSSASWLVFCSLSSSTLISSRRLDIANSVRSRSLSARISAIDCGREPSVRRSVSRTARSRTTGITATPMRVANRKPIPEIHNRFDHWHNPALNNAVTPQGTESDLAREGSFELKSWFSFLRIAKNFARVVYIIPRTKVLAPGVASTATRNVRPRARHQVTMGSSARSSTTIPGGDQTPTPSSISASNKDLTSSQTTNQTCVDRAW